MKVLIIDDSKAMRMILSKILADIGCEVSDAAHGLEALEKIASEGKPDLALVDWNMPEMNGLEFIQAVRAKPDYASISLMMITTESEIENVNAARAAGVNEYIIKPFSTQIILEKLQVMGFDLANSPLNLLKIKAAIAAKRSTEQ